jgi:flagellar protein FliO/FliZ
MQLLQQAAASLGHAGLLLDLLRSLLALAGVCLLAWLSLRWLSRRGLGRAAIGPAASLRVLQRLPLEPRKNLYLVQMGKRVLLIGTGDGGAPSLLAELERTALESEVGPGAGDGPHA